MDGNFIGADFTVSGSEVLDAGTEVNDEAEDTTAFFGQSAPNTGETENGLVQIHPGFALDGRILSSSDFASGDFTTEDYQVARITVTAEDIEPVPAENNNGVEVYRFYNNNSGLEFYTTDEFERDYIIENLSQYELEGVAFVAANEPEGDDITGLSPVYRFFNSSTGVHMYTMSAGEKDAVLENPNYSFEGISYHGYDAQAEGTVPLYRFYNSELDAHFYTSSVEERDTYLDSSDFQSEGENGIAFYVEPVEI